MKMFCALLLSFSSLLGMAQTNQKALDDFSTRFGGEASWANEGGQIVASFKKGAGPAYAEYSTDGQFLGLASLTDFNALPEKAKETLNRGFTGSGGMYQVEYVRVFSTESSPKFAALMAANGQHLKLYFNEAGDMVQRSIWQ
jgi:hypothetical protein